MLDKNKKLILVLGMHRSGTSAIAKSLELSGVYLGNSLHPPGPDNPMGFWEDRDFLKINEEILSLLNSGYDRLIDTSNGVFNGANFDELKQKAIHLIKNKFRENENIWGFKDPRASRLLPFWKYVLDALKCEVGYVVVSRNPLSVAHSLWDRNSIPFEKSYYLWVQHALDILSEVASNNAVFVNYDSFLDNPYIQCKHIASRLGLDLPTNGDQLVLDFEKIFLKRDLRHTKFTIQELEQQAPDLVLETYLLLESLENGRQTLDDQGVKSRIVELNQKLSSLKPLFNYVNNLEDQRADLWDREIERNHQISECHQAVGYRDKKIEEFHLALEERDQQIAALQKVEEDHDKKIEEFHLALEERDQQIAVLQKVEEDHNKKIEEFHLALEERDQQIAALQKVEEDHNKKNEEFHLALEERDQQIAALQKELESNSWALSEPSEAFITLKKIESINLNKVLGSNSWKITAPLRFLRRHCISTPRQKASTYFDSRIRQVWRALPFPSRYKNRIKNIFFQNGLGKSSKFETLLKWDIADSNEGQIYVQRTKQAPIHSKSVKIICFYLPQFHAIDENNEWWGDGFTEWVNVKPAMPSFVGHYQPHEPGELGYYNLLDKNIQSKQIELARLYGIEGFCFYFYWFSEKRLLEAPLLNYLEDKDLDLPFCLCWANENWSRRWDGLDSEILIQQDYSEDDDLKFIQYISKYLNDPRYIRINGKPLLLVYRPSLFPSMLETASRWRDWCRNHGIGEIYLAYTQSFETVNPSDYDFDAAIEFPPNNSNPPDITEATPEKKSEFVGSIYDWRIFLKRSEEYVEPAYTLFRSVCPGWDNTARRKDRATIFRNSHPNYYRQWLTNAIKHTIKYRGNKDERLVFINAWNEWAEGAHLEPDLKYGYAYLQATRDALEFTKASNDSLHLLLVTHDCHPHGAQFLALEVARELMRNGYKLSIIALKGGKLESEFSQLGPMLIVEDVDQVNLIRFLVDLRNCGCNKAIASTTVSGQLLPLLKKCEFQVLSLVHELPGVIKSMGLEDSAKKIAELSDVTVFPAKLVQDQFADLVGLPVKKSIIRPQGLLRTNPYQVNVEAAYKLVCNRHGLPEGARIILNVGFLDYRKGPDIFVEIAALVCRAHKDIYFIWVGHADHEMECLIKKRIVDLGLEKNILFTGFIKEPFEYYAAATIFALTSREDPFPNVVLESVSVGVPVIAFEGATGAADFIVDHGGALALSLDALEFSKKISSILEAPTNRSKVNLDADYSLHKYVLDLMHYLDGKLRVSVIVPNYNYGRLIERRLDSIFSQAYTPYEIIVLDDASTDHSSEEIKKYQKKSKFPLKIYENQVNSGSVFQQWVKGVRYASGDLIWIAEADDLSNPLFLSTLVPAFGIERLVLAYCQSRQVDEYGNTLADDYLGYVDELQGCWLHEKYRDGFDEIIDGLSIKNSIPNVSAVIFDRKALISAFNDVGDELFEYKVAGDWLVYLHVLTQGKLYFNPKTMNDHCRHSGSVTNAISAINHISEVKRVQEKVFSIVELDQYKRDMAEVYLQNLCRQFGVSDLIAQDHK